MMSSIYPIAFTKIFPVKPNSIVSSGSINTSDLTSGQLGVFDAKTFQRVTLDSTNRHKLFMFAQGSFHTTDSLSEFLGGLKESVKSRPINARYIKDFYKACPKRLRNEIWTIGYNGVSACNGISGKCSNIYTIRVDLKGEFILNTYNRNLYRYFSVETPCCDECAENNCEQASVDSRWITEQFVNKINNDPEISKFVLAEAIYEDLATGSPLNDNALLSYTITTSAATTGEAVEDFYTSAISVTANSTTSYTVVLPSDATAPAIGNIIDATPDPDITVTAVTQNDIVRPTRFLCITLPKQEGASGLADVNSWLSSLGRTDLVGNATATDGTSSEVITIEQYAEEWVERGVDIMETPTYAFLPAYVLKDSDGNIILTAEWAACPCPTAPAEYTEGAGIKLTSAFVSTKFGLCSFDPADAFYRDFIKIDVSLVDDGEYCSDKHVNWTVTQLQSGQNPSGLGETMLRDYLLSMGYKQEFFENDPRWREVLDQNHLSVFDRDKYYTVYYLRHFIPNSFKNGMSYSNYDEHYNLMFVFEETDTAGMSAFEALVGINDGANSIFGLSEVADLASTATVPSNGSC